MADTILEIKNLRAGYGEIEVLHGLDMAIHRGEIVALLGSNGAGKTTLNNTLSGVIKPKAGSIVFGGQDIAGHPSKAVVQAGLIHVPEGRKIYPNMNIRENLELGAYRRGKSKRRENMEKVLETFPRLRERLDQLAGTLSGGEQQMLAIGRGMMADPEFLILDEPSLGLSPLLVEEMFELILHLNKQGLTIMLVEQNVVQSLEIANRAYVLENGSMVLSGDARDMMNNDDLRKFYLGM